MTTTIKAMKQAHAILQSGDLLCEVTAASILREAIATEEAQGVELVYLVATGLVHDGQETYTRHDVRPPLCDAEKLFTRPTQPPTKKQKPLIALQRACVAILREEGHLIDDEGEVTNQLEQVADMLAADAREVERKYISPVRTTADLVNNLLLMDQALPIYGAQYIDHPTRGRCAIAVSPTVSRERVQDSRWIGQGNELNAAIVWTRAAQQVAVPQGWTHIHVTEAMHRAAVKVLHRASGLDGLPQRMMNVMLASAPHPPNVACDSPELCKLNGECAGQYGTKQRCTAAPTPPRAERVPMTPEQISDTYQKATGQHLRPCDKHAVETLTREIEAHHKIGVKQ